jgi:uncharacterized protein (TIGR00730 family)
VTPPLRRICVFCGSSKGKASAYATTAGQVGRVLAARRIGLVYGGGNIGLMGVVADAVLGAGGEVIGVIPEALMAREVGHRGLRDLRIVKSMHERKALMAELSDGFVALPGGFGTLEEFLEVITWAQLGLHAKPCGVLNVSAFFTPLLHLLDHAVAEGFVRVAHRELVLADASLDSLLDRMQEFRPPAVHKWIDKESV